MILCNYFLCYLFFNKKYILILDALFLLALHFLCHSAMVKNVHHQNNLADNFVYIMIIVLKPHCSATSKIIHINNICMQGKKNICMYSTHDTIIVLLV